MELISIGINAIPWDGLFIALGGLNMTAKNGFDYPLFFCVELKIQIVNFVAGSFKKFQEIIFVYLIFYIGPSCLLLCDKLILGELNMFESFRPKRFIFLHF